MLRSFTVAADQIVSIIEDECASALEVTRQQLEQAQSQFNAFRNAAYASYAANDATIENLTRKVLVSLDRYHLGFNVIYRTVQEYKNLLHTLNKVDIYYHHGSYASSALSPNQVGAALADQCRFENSQRNRDLAEIARLENLVRWYREFHETKFPPALNTDVGVLGRPSLVQHARAEAGRMKPLKREMEAEDLEPAAKRSRLDVPVLTPILSATTRSNYSSAAGSPLSGVATPTFCQPLLYPVPGKDSIGSSPQPTMASARMPVSSVICRWNCTLTENAASKPSRGWILPPLAAFVDAHACTYYLWFSIRMSLYGRVGDPQYLKGRTASTAEQWELKLYNDRKGKRNFSFNETVFDVSQTGPRCVCGMPPLLPSIRQKIPHRADESPIQASDFDSPVLRGFLIADLELAHAKLQFEQTDDILLEAESWSVEEWSQRQAARATIFRNAWDLSFAAVPLETPDLISRRPWIVRFQDLLRYWPDFELVGPFPVPEIEGEATPEDLEALASFERRMIAFYLETVSRTLGISPARPRHRPEVDALPELYRNIL
ncbi:hypothetical protein K438DRAFT_1964210 [Mycena galopus ATCC 62051]|nr:hypothetical protein K438DRAFT_1964210 [Mycena galopus ATCC 62051]